MPADVTPPPKRRPAYFWWLVANSLALCFAVLSWTFCLQVFGNPEVPRHYRIMQALGRAPEFRLFAIGKIPNGGGFAAKDLYALCIPKDKSSLHSLNAALCRNYLQHLSDSRMVKFIEGRFRVEAVRPLHAADFLSHGIGVRLRAMEAPDEFTPAMEFPVVIDLLLPGEHTTAAAAPGAMVDLTRKSHAVVLTQVRVMQLRDEPTVCATAVPIAAAKLPLSGPDGPVVVVGPHGMANPAGNQPLF